MKTQIPHPFDFDPTYGHTPEMLRATHMTEPAPQDFDVFWKNLREVSAKTPMELDVKELDSPEKDYRLLRIDYRVFPDYRAGAWVIVPKDISAVNKAWVVGHGYGGRDGPEWWHARCDRIVIFPVAPGFQISADPRLPLNDSWKHVVHGIESPETYILGSCAAACWRAVDAVEALLPGVPLRFHYLGWSFGGGIGVLMLPWEPRFQSAEIGQPTFGNHTLRLQYTCNGSGEAVRRLWLERPEIAETLRYYDAVFAARKLTIPTVYACSQFDPAVPPPGQFSVFNAHAGPKRLSAFTTGHFEETISDKESEMRIHENHLRELLGSF
jgi:cephalosporin-C deacetylase